MKRLATLRSKDNVGDGAQSAAEREARTPRNPTRQKAQTRQRGPQRKTEKLLRLSSKRCPGHLSLVTGVAGDQEEIGHFTDRAVPAGLLRDPVHTLLDVRMGVWNGHR